MRFQTSQVSGGVVSQKRGYGLRVTSGDASEGRRGVRNSVAVFYRLRKFKEARGDVVGKYKRCSSDSRAGAATKLGERVLRVCLQRPDRSVLNLIATADLWGMKNPRLLAREGRIRAQRPAG